MPDPESGPDTRSHLVDQLCEEFEASWRVGTPIPLEDIIRNAPEDVRNNALRELLTLERDYRARAGRPLTPQEVRERLGTLGAWAIESADELIPTEPSVILDVMHGPAAGRSFPLAGHATFAVGRQPGLHISLPDDPHLSRMHCLVEVNLPLVRVVDLQSKTGTYVNGERVNSSDLRDGDEVRAGRTVFRVAIPSAVGGATLSLPDDGHSERYTGSWHGGPPSVPGYRLGAELGRGAMGIVYRAERIVTGELVAIKTLLPTIPPTRTALGRFLREADILRQLTHPHVVGFREAGAAGGLLYFVMEYVPGKNAADVVRKDGPLTVERALRWADQFLEALAHAHEKGFVHRDVKPSNMLVVGEIGTEVVKISDFGLARAYENSSMSGLTVANASGGTPAFMPPEQVTEFRSVRPAADQYAAAATLFHLLTGRDVYERAGSSQAMLRRILVEEPLPLLPGGPPIPDPFGPVIRKALSRDPAHRYPSVRHMRTALIGG